MNHINKGDINCQPPQGSENLKTDLAQAEQLMGANWFWSDGKFCTNLGSIKHSNMGNPLKVDDFKGNLTIDLFHRVYENKTYSAGAAIRFSKNESALNFGVYVHMGSWRFYDGSGNEFTAYNDFVTGFISTAATICHEFSYATIRLYYESGSANEAIQLAEKEGRTMGLGAAKDLFQKSLDFFATANYKTAGAYAVQSKKVAESATVPSSLPQMIVVIGIMAVSASVGIGAYYKTRNKKEQKRIGKSIASCESILNNSAIIAVIFSFHWES